jgi:hypothetical protein
MHLQDLRDVDTGERVVSAFTRPSSELSGPRATILPDLLIHYAAGRIPRAVVSPTLGRIEGRRSSLRPGNHAVGGFVFAAGTIATSAIADVWTMAGFGPLAEKVLGRGQRLLDSGVS